MAIHIIIDGYNFLKALFPKILGENWVQLMCPFHKSGYEYVRIVKKLKESGDYDALISLAKIILTPRLCHFDNSG